MDWPLFLLGSCAVLLISALITSRIIRARRTVRLAGTARSLGWRLSKGDRFSLATRLADVSSDFAGDILVRDILYRPIGGDAHAPRLAFIATVHAVEELDGRPIGRRLVIATHETATGLAPPHVNRVGFNVDQAYRDLAVESATMDPDAAAERLFGGA